MQDQKQRSLLNQKPSAPEFSEIKVKPVDDLLAELQAVADAPKSLYADLMIHDQRPADCCMVARCSCGPCRQGNCIGCVVEETRRAFGDGDVRSRFLIETYRHTNRG